jgi:hypothetical protein
MVVNECITASNQLMPAQRSDKMHSTVTTPYTTHRPLAVSAMRGVRLESFIGPGVSALNICRPPMPSRGSTATASTIRPMPPSQTSIPRQRFIEGGSLSSPDSTVAPVVVSPDMASK